MKHLRVRLTANGREAEIHPVYAIVTTSSFVTRATALQWNFTGEAFGILHYIEGNLDRFESVIADIEQVVDYELEPVSEGSFYAYIWDATTGPLRVLLAPILDGGLIAVPPVIYHETGHVSLSVFGPSDVLQSSLENLPSPIEVRIEQVGGLRGAIPTAGIDLSERQREAVEIGLEIGYYETPREASQREIARVMDCTPSTVAEHLQKAEAALVRDLLTLS